MIMFHRCLLFLHLMTLSAYVRLHADTYADSISIIINHAVSQTEITRYYDPSYVKIGYPGGDVPSEQGVCTDVIIRAFRAAGIDLQKEIHEDMKLHFDSYPKLWGLRRPDPNIDHRRVPNIVTFLTRKGKGVDITNNGADYLPGDIVVWKIPGDLDHIGLVVKVAVGKTDRFSVVHNLGRGAQVEDVLFEYKITGHYRYFPALSTGP
ncbi:MAG TPA: DUF1287 domain-containing protein [Chitinispirillaceae bacterium]|nr:DUF1287 domain-containing protein [Chitinispirillaceae bacterium]